MKEKPIIITIDNYNKKKITFTIPSDATVEIMRMADMAEIFTGAPSTFSNIEIGVEHEGIEMKVEHL